MATQSPSKLDEEILVCSICLETLNEPKILGCLHRYCKKCIAGVIEKAPDAGTFRCPTCRQEYGVPDGGVDGIKGDFLLEAVLENRKLERDLREKQKEQICSSCDKHTIMVAICVDCGGFVCEVCHSSHKVMKTFRSHHHVVTLEDIESGKITFDVQSVTSTLKAPKCLVHKDMILHINCQTCNKLICPVCAPLHHSTHQLEEIATAAEKIKESVRELVQKSVKSGETLETRMGEFRKTSQAKLNEILETVVQLERAADQEEQNLRHAEQESLIQLEEKKKMITKETEVNIRSIRQSEALLVTEIKMLKNFCTETSKTMEKHAEEKMMKMRNTQVTAQMLAKDVDNWSVLLAAPDIQHNLQIPPEDIEINLLEQAIGNLNNLVVKFRNLKISALESKCWAEKWSLNLPKIDHVWFKKGHEKKLCDMKFIQATEKLVTIAQQNLSVVISVIDLKSKAITQQFMYFFRNSTSAPQNVSITGIQTGSIYSISEKVESNWSYLVNETSDKKSNSVKFHLKIRNPVVSCTAQCKKNNELLVGLCGSTTLHRCNFSGVVLSSFGVKVEGIHPPVSLASSNEGNTLLCDGVSKAIAVSPTGKQLFQYSGRNISDRPLVISEDLGGLVYILWNVRDDEGKRNGSEEAAGSNTNTTSTNVVRQYSSSGMFISEFIAGNAFTMMTAVVTDDDENSVTVGTPEGLIQCYSMTSFGRSWSNFIHQHGSEEAQK